MKRIQADFTRRIALPGVPEPVQRPVDIDRTITDFTHLRSLRIYQFPIGTAIDGHAEEDEVFLVLLRGIIQLKLGTDEAAAAAATPIQLVAPDDRRTDKNPCAAYLPPEGAYFLEASQDSVVAYARATPASGSPPLVFSPDPIRQSDAITFILADQEYGQRLRFRLYQVATRAEGVVFEPKTSSESGFEGLLYVQTSSETADDAAERKVVATASSRQDADTLTLFASDTLAIDSREEPNVLVSPNASCLLLLVLAF